MRLHTSPVATLRLLALAVLLSALSAGHLSAQRSGDFGLTYTQERSKFLGAGGNYFSLRGASVDGSVELLKGLGLSATATGVSAVNLDGHIDLEQIQFIGGPRYTLNLGHNTDAFWGRRGALFVEGKAGYTFAISGAYPGSAAVAGTTAALTYYGGGGLNFRVYQRLDWRLIEAGEVRTQLPNGGSNRQNTLRLSSRINFHFGR